MRGALPASLYCLFEGCMQNRRRVIAAILAAVGSGIFSHGAVAETAITAALPNFSGSNGALLQKNGDTAISGGSLRLTRSQGTIYGTAFLKDLVTLPTNRSFSAYFTFRITEPKCGLGGGADGLTFIVQTDSSSVGSMGGGIGYAGILPSVAVEFDTFKNNEFKDPNSNHIGISLNGDPESVATVNAPFPLIDGNVYHAWVDYDGRNNVLQVRLGDTDSRPSEATISHKVELESIFGDRVYAGFTAATGTCSEQHEILSFYFNNDELVGGIDTSLDSFVSSSGE